MCTVTLVPLTENKFILTSNRDEAIDRETIFPEFYKINNSRMLFPRDAVAGGTWIGLSDHNRMICLLNGAFHAHKRIPPYRRSRGVVVTDFLSTKNVEKTVQEYDFEGIEPFTLITADWQSELFFYELVWDGSRYYFRTLEKKTHIWSSSTLYTQEMKEMRGKWFAEYEKTMDLNPNTLLHFHKNAGIGNADLDLQIDRGSLKTRSITQIVKDEEEVRMRYENLQDNRVSTISFEEVAV